ncbi:Zona pellucida domain-containing protein [Aphelenchoides besseyi]|nr:Zona pellucida domain-containing protein [Aphelenchoides besseyi]KAI6194781.1 Zona pellucida domain-containing protein [Aphelenchoides besseyi]
MHGLQYLSYFLLFVIVHGLNEPPQLECSNDGMRLHFAPDEDRPFNGHVYVKGFFFSRNCHLDFTQHSLDEPFYFHVTYRSECQVHHQKTTDPAGQSYSIVVIVQHHPLFLTEIDKAYSLTCFYRDEKSRLEQSLEISDITTAQIQDEPTNPDCVYEVLAGGIEGHVVKFASIGDILVHKWTCETMEQGILVHSCFVRDGLGNEFSLLDDRGCITDGSLIQQPLAYTDSLNTCYATINSFRFAEQPIVYFSCQITLCRKAEQGCEGITPPVCEFQPLPDEGGETMPTAANTSSSRTTSLFRTITTTPSSLETVTSITGVGQSTTSSSITTQTSTTDQELGSTEALHGDEDETNIPLLFRSSPFASSRHARSVNQRPRRNITELVTVDVMADSLIILTKDENPALSHLISQKQVEGNCPQTDRFSIGGWIFLLILIVTTFVSLLWFQRRYYIDRLNHLSAVSYELGFVNVAASNKTTPQTRRSATAISPFVTDPFSR